MSQTGYTYNLIADNDIIPWIDDESTKYKWNGALRSFNDMDPSEYAKTIFNIYGIVITGSTGTTLITNEVNLSVGQEEGKYVIKVSPKYSFASEQQLTVTIMGSEFFAVIPQGTKDTQIITGISVEGENPEITDARITPGKDDVYIYELKIETRKLEYTAYHGVVLETKAVSLSVEDIVGMEMSVINPEGKILEFEIPRRIIETPTEEDLKYCKYCLIFVLPKSIYEGGHYSIVDSAIGASSGFVLQPATYRINNEDCVLLCNYSDGNEFVGRYRKEISYNFTAKYKTE